MTLAEFSMAAFALLKGGRTVGYVPQMAQRADGILHCALERDAFSPSTRYRDEMIRQGLFS
jgi:hypothetical protein